MKDDRVENIYCGLEMKDLPASSDAASVDPDATRRKAPDGAPSGLALCSLGGMSRPGSSGTSLVFGSGFGCRVQG